MGAIGRHTPRTLKRNGRFDSDLSSCVVRAKMTEWRVSGVAQPEPGHSIRIVADGTPVAVFNLGGRLLAVSARCTHVGGPLDRGTVTGEIVTCPLHGSQFDLTSGKVVRGPATQAVRAYRVRVDSGDLVLEAD